MIQWLKICTSTGSVLGQGVRPSMPCGVAKIFSNLKIKDTNLKLKNIKMKINFKNWELGINIHTTI